MHELCKTRAECSGYSLLLYRGCIEQGAGRQMRVRYACADRGLVSTRARASDSASVIFAAYTTHFLLVLNTSRRKCKEQNKCTIDEVMTDCRNMRLGLYVTFFFSRLKVYPHIQGHGRTVLRQGLQ